MFNWTVDVKDHPELFNHRSNQADIMMILGTVYSVPKIMEAAGELPVQPWTLSHFQDEFKAWASAPAWPAGDRVLPPLEVLSPDSLFISTYHPGVRHHVLRMLNCDLSKPLVVDPFERLIDGTHRMCRLLFAWIGIQGALPKKKPSGLVHASGQPLSGSDGDEEGAFKRVMEKLKPAGFVKFDRIDQMDPAIIAQHHIAQEMRDKTGTEVLGGKKTTHEDGKRLEEARGEMLAMYEDDSKTIRAAWGPKTAA